MEKSVSKEPFWATGAEEVLAALKTDQNGLSEEEAKTRFKLFGPNIIKERGRLTKVKIIFHQLKSPLIIILVSAGIITFFLNEFVDAGVIFGTVIINTFLGFWQENKAEKAIDFLKSYIKTRARVKRIVEREVDSEILVPGDIIRISRGDRVPADARVIFSNNLEIDESVLTGESLPVAKNVFPLPAATALADRKSMLFSGTLAVEGFADAVITATGELTEFGRIAGLVYKKEREETPLERSLSRFSHRIGIFLAFFVLIVFFLGLFFEYGVLEMFLISVAIAVSAVPEGLPIAMTVILAVGVQRLAIKKGVVRRLLAAETLGSTSLILTDKTGTLTQAKMELAAIIPYGESNISKEKLLSYALLNTDVVLENPDDHYENWRVFGRALDTSLVKAAAKEGVFLNKVLTSAKILDRLPFSSSYKYSAVALKFDSREEIILFGAPDIILGFTDMSDEEKATINREIEKRAYQGEKVLGAAWRNVGEKNYESMIHKQEFSGFVFLGLLSFRDPLRPSAAKAMNQIALAGVKTVMVTGDYYGTAEAIARELGMVDDGKGKILSGRDLIFLKKEELAADLNNISVFARVSPDQKLMLTKLYQEKGEVVAVTGDGVNDAPALQAADIGVALGSGSDVAKEVADLVILDDNFETITTAIEEGRRILDNIRKVIVYLLSDAFDELFLIGGALLFSLPLPINALQILFVNLFSDSFPAIALAFEKGIDTAGEKPRKLDKNLFDPTMRLLIMIIGVFTSIFLFILYFLMTYFNFPQDLVRTFIFASFATYTLFLAFSLRSLEKNIFFYNPFSNIYLTAGVGIGLILTFAVIYLPFFQMVFKTVSLPLGWFLAVGGVGILNILAVEFGKWILRKR